MEAAGIPGNVGPNVLRVSRVPAASTAILLLLPEARPVWQVSDLLAFLRTEIQVLPFLGHLEALLVPTFKVLQVDMASPYFTQASFRPLA